jgi:hypothetical protein
MHARLSVACEYGDCREVATHWVHRHQGSRRSGPVCSRHAKACGARFPREQRPVVLTEALLQALWEKRRLAGPGVYLSTASAVEPTGGVLVERDP